MNCILKLFLLANLLYFISAFTLEGDILLQVQQRNQNVQSTYDMANSRVTLNQGEYVAFPNVKGKFIFYDLPLGKYLLQVEDPFYNFHSIVIDVQEKSQVCYYYQINERKTIEQTHCNPIKIMPISQKVYFMEREAFSIYKLLFNPMILMTIVPLGLMYFASKMPQQMDKEQLKDMKEMYSQMNQGWFANLLNPPQS